MYRESTQKFEKEESVCGAGGTQLLSLDTASPISTSQTPPKLSCKGEDKENVKPNKANGSSRTGNFRLRSPPLGDGFPKGFNSPEKTLSVHSSKSVHSVMNPILQNSSPTMSGRDLSELGERAVSTLLLLDTHRFRRPRSTEEADLGDECYRKSCCENDADDEGSDKETYAGSDDEVTDELQIIFQAVEQDDEELRSAMTKVQLGKRNRASDEDGSGQDLKHHGVRLCTPTEDQALQERVLQEYGPEKDLVKGLDAQSLGVTDADGSAPAKRRKGSEAEALGSPSSLSGV